MIIPFITLEKSQVFKVLVAYNLLTLTFKFSTLFPGKRQTMQIQRQQRWQRRKKNMLQSLVANGKHGSCG
jgi:hypothetical protein